MERECEECGREIPKKRLEAMPETTLCCGCQAEKEKWDNFLNGEGKRTFRPPRTIPEKWGSTYNGLIAGVRKTPPIPREGRKTNFNFY